VATSLQHTLARVRQLPSRQGLALLALLQLVLTFWIPWRLSLVPSLPFDVGSDLVVRALPDTPGALSTPNPIPALGDQVVAVNGVAISTRAELLSALRAVSSADLTIRRFNVPLVKALTAASFEFGLPVGLQDGDTPVGLACQGSASYVEVRAVNLEALEELVRERSQEGDVKVVFNRPQQDEATTVAVQRLPWRHDWMAGLAVGFLAILLLGWLSSRSPNPDAHLRSAQHATLLSALIILAELATLAATQRPLLSADPWLFAVAVTGLALFKPLNLDLHLRARSGWASTGLPIKLAIYTAPLIFLGQILFFHIRRVSSSSLSAAARDGIEQQLSRFGALLLGASALLLAVDVLTLLIRYHVRGKDDSTPAAFASQIGLGFGALSALAAIYLVANGASSSLVGYAIAASVGAQLLGDLGGALELPRAHWHDGDPQAALSPARLRQFLLRASDLLPNTQVWLVVRLVPLMSSSGDKTLRSQPRALHARLSLSRDEEVGHLLIARSVPPEWIDLLDVLQTEGGIIPRDLPPGGEDPLDGMAQRLSIACAWPIDTQHASALLSAHLVATCDDDADQLAPWPPSQIPSEALAALNDDFIDITSSVIYHAALGASPAITQAAAARALASPPVASPAPSPAAPSDVNAPRPSNRRLRATLRAMQAEFERLHPIDSFDPTPAQEDTLDQLLRAEASALLLCGEVGVGKALLARLLHKRLELPGAFVRLPAHELPEAVLPIELFGDDDAPGLLEASRDGLLLIEAADRLSHDIFLSLMEARDAMSSPPRLLLTIDLPSSPSDPLARFDADVASLLPDPITLRPLRQQLDAIEPLALAFLHRASMRHGRVITELDPDTLASLRLHTWPGNIQEMKHTIDAAVIRCPSLSLRAVDLSFPPLLLSSRALNADAGAADADAADADAAGADAAGADAADANASAAASSAPLDALGVDRALDELFSSPYDDIERRLITAAMRAAQGSKSKASKMLGMRRDIFNAKLNKLGLEPPPSPQDTP
jgi:transcriptional regulator with AAA-type ATPase domain